MRRPHNIGSYLTSYHYTRLCGGTREEAAQYGEEAGHEPASGTLHYSPWTGLTLEEGLTRIEDAVARSPYYDPNRDVIVPPDLNRYEEG